MALIDKLKAAFGSAWHTNSDAALQVIADAAAGDQVVTSLSVTGSAAIGSAASSYLGFFGATKVQQQAAITAVSVTAPIAISGGFGFQTSAQMIALITAVNALQAEIKNLGLTA